MRGGQHPVPLPWQDTPPCWVAVRFEAIDLRDNGPVGGSEVCQMCHVEVALGPFIIITLHFYFFKFCFNPPSPFVLQSSWNAQSLPGWRGESTANLAGDTQKFMAHSANASSQQGWEMWGQLYVTLTC